MNFYQSTLIIFTILFIVVMLFVYYLFVSKKTSIKSKYNSCPDYWTMDPATGFCNPLGTAFIVFGPPKDTTTSITSSNILDLVSAETKGNVIQGNTLTTITPTSTYFMDITSTALRLKLNTDVCDEITLIFVISTKASITFDLMTAYNANSDGTFKDYSYYITGSSTTLSVSNLNSSNNIIYTANIAFAASKTYVISICLKKSYTASEGIKLNVNGKDYTTDVGKVSGGTAIASSFTFNNNSITFGNCSGTTSNAAISATTNSYYLYKFVQFNYNVLSSGTVYDTSAGFVNFNDPKWYSDYNSQSLECSWQQWCRKNNIQWSGITNGTFC